MVYRRSEAEKNCTQVELDIARLDECKIQWLASPKEIIGENGKVTALICDVMKLGVPDISGKPAAVPTGDIITLEVDMVIKATGQSPFAELVDQSGLENRRGNILVKDKSATNIVGVFAGGDAGCISNCRTNNCKFSKLTPFIMTKEQLIVSISAHYDELNALNKIDNFYDYESDFIRLWATMGREVLEKNISTLPGDRRKKNSKRFWGADNSQVSSL